jgi:hypothetical protein
MCGGKDRAANRASRISRLPALIEPRLQCCVETKNHVPAHARPSAPMIETRNAWVSIREQLVNLVIVDPDQKCPLEGSSRYRSQVGCFDLRHDLVTVCFLRFPSGD